MTTQIKPGDSVVVEIGRGLTKHGSVQRLAENTVYVKHYNGSVVGYKPELVTTLRMVEQTQRSYGTGLSSELAAIQQILESKTSVVVSEEVAEMPANSMSAYINDLDQLTEKKHLTAAELKKREEVAKAIERENPGMDMSKKMAIATATAKKVAEETDDEHYAKQSKPMQTAINLHLRKGKSYKDAVAAAQKHVKEETVEEAKSHTVPKTEKEKDLAALAEPKDKITHADVMVGRGVKKEEVELDEAMISYSDFQSKIDAHKKAGNKIKDDKYDKNKASYTVIDQDGVGKKITHTPSGTKQDHLGQVEKVKDVETQTTEKRGRGRPAGSKSGARN